MTVRYLEYVCTKGGCDEHDMTPSSEKFSLGKMDKSWSPFGRVNRKQGKMIRIKEGGDIEWYCRDRTSSLLHTFS